MSSIQTNNHVFVTRKEDNFTFEKPRWVAHLSSGEIVIADDGRPGVSPPQAWHRLREYCRQTGLCLVNLSLQFRSNFISPLPADAEGYYLGYLYEAVQGGPEFNSFLIGYVHFENVYLSKYVSPALALMSSEIRPLEAVKRPADSIIWRDNERNLSRVDGETG